MKTGVVLWFKEDRGFGFIKCDDGTQDAFVHYTAIVGVPGRRNLCQGQLVEFEVIPGAKGPVANNVRVTKPAKEERTA